MQSNWQMTSLLLAAVLFLTPAGAHAEKRVALVVGIADYETLPDLKNTVNDGKLMQTTLAALNFDVTSLENPRADALREKIAEFQFQAETADVALVYFAGHGMEVGGRNFLIPADSLAQSRKEIAQSSISLENVLAAVDRARQLRIVILDSCRDDPFQPVNQTEIVTFSTQDNRRNRAGPAVARPGDPRCLCRRGWKGRDRRSGQQQPLRPGAGRKPGNAGS